MANALVDVRGSILSADANRRANESNALRNEAVRQNISQSRKAFSEQEQLINTQFLADASGFVLNNPKALPGALAELQRRGIIDPNIKAEDVTFDQIFEMNQNALGALGGAPQADREILKDAAGFQRDVNTGERLFPDVEIPENAGVGNAEGFFNRNIIGLTEEQQRQARDVELGLVPRAGTTSSVERIAGDPDVTESVAESRGTIAESVETAKQQAQISAIPAKVEAQFKADFKAGAQKRIRAANDAIARIDTVMEEAQLGIDDIGLTTTGLLGSINRKIAGTTAFALARKIDTIQANLSFDRIAEMRKNSPTGGALGQVSERELSLLGAAVVALDQANNEQEVKRAFTKILFHYNNWKAVLTGQNEADALLNERDITEEQPDTQQQGAPTATGPNGEKLILQNGQWVSVSG